MQLREAIANSLPIVANRDSFIEHKEAIANSLPI